MPTSSKKKQKGNPPVRTPRPARPAMTKQVHAMVKRLNRKPTIRRG